MDLYGYAGKILFLDLNKGKTEEEVLDHKLADKFIGGAGINVKLAYDLVSPSVDPLSPENAIILGSGPFNGTIIPGSSKLVVMYKSPLNGAFLLSIGGGMFSAFMKSSGYDHIFITGKAKRPVYLKIEDGKVEIIDATDLWGLDSYDTTDMLRKRHEPCSIIPIGPAGENLVNISVSQIDKGGTVGSGGLPAVMGSKNIKALVAVLGHQGIPIADPLKLQLLVDNILGRIVSYHRRPEMMLGGSMAMTMDWTSPEAMARCSSTLLPYPPDIKDIQKGVYEIHKKCRSKIACISCPMSDKDRLDVAERDIHTYHTALMSELAITSTSPAFAYRPTGSYMDRYSDALILSDMLNRYGIDEVYSFRGIIDFVITLYEDGVLTKNDVDGIDLNRKFETILKLGEMIAFRKGIGNVLANGIIKAAEIIGRGADKYVNNVVKGQYIFSDPRLWGLGPMQFAALVYPGRTLNVGGGMGAATYSPGWPIDEIRRQAIRCGVPDNAMGYIFEGNSFNVGRLVKHGQDFFGLFNMLGQCHRLYISRFDSFKELTDLYCSLTNREVTVSDLKLASERVWNMWKLLNIKAGFTRKDDEPPDIWFQPLKGQAKDHILTDYFRIKNLQRNDVDKMLDDYYDERGWDISTGVPTANKLKQLEIS